MSFRNFPAGIVALAGASAVTDPAFTGGPYFVIDSAAGPPAEAEIRLNADGSVIGQTLNFPDTLEGTWDNNQGGILTMSDYDFRWDITGGSLNSPGSQAGNTWINGFDGMYWGVRENGFGVTSCQGTLRIRPAGGGADLDTLAFNNVNAETV